MIIKNGTLHYNSSRGVFWQKSHFFIDEQNEFFRTIIICVSEEFFAEELRKKLADIMGVSTNDIDIQKWFADRIATIAVMEKEIEDQSLGNVIIDLHPQTEGMLDAAKSFLNNTN